MPFTHFALSLRRLNRQQPLLLWASLSLLCLLFLAAGYYFGRNALTQELIHQNQRWSSTFATYLSGVVTQADMMAATLAEAPDLQRYAHDYDPAATAAVNARLERLQPIADADVLYLVDPLGRVRAASNWRQPTSFIGLELAFRPYVQQALQQGRGAFIGVGVQTGEVGLYRAVALRDGARVLGVVVVKVNLQPIETVMDARVRPASWEYFLSDDSGVVFATSRPAWRFHALRPLTKEERTRMAQARQYPQLPVPELAAPFALAASGSEAYRDAEELAPLGLDSGYHVKLVRIPEANIWLGTFIPRTEGMRAFLAYFSPAVSLVLLLSMLLVGLWHDQRRQLSEHSRDLLTGLGLRRQMVQQVGDVIAAGLPLSLILCDLDHFKRINDRSGHLEGDRLLQEAGRLFLEAVRTRDICIRYGGEEFAIFLVGCNLPKALQIAEKLRQGVKELALTQQPAPVVTLSAGVTQHRPGETLTDLLQRADALLYRAKQEGRDRCVPSADGDTPCTPT